MLNEYIFLTNEIQTGNHKRKAAGIKKSENITVTYKDTILQFQISNKKKMLPLSSFELKTTSFYREKK